MSACGRSPRPVFPGCAFSARVAAATVSRAQGSGLPREVLSPPEVGGFAARAGSARRPRRS